MENNNKLADYQKAILSLLNIQKGYIEKLYKSKSFEDLDQIYNLNTNIEYELKMGIENGK